MNEHTPIAVNLHQKSRLLEITFDSAENYKLSCDDEITLSPKSQ